MTNNIYINNQNISYLAIYKIVGGMLFLSVIMAMLFQISTSGICHSKASIIFLYSVAFWGISGYGLFNWSKKGQIKSSKVILVGLTTLLLNQVIIRYGVEGTMEALYGCGDFTQNWIPYLISNNLLINLLCFTAFTLTNQILNPPILKRPSGEEMVEVSNSTLEDIIEPTTKEKNTFTDEILIKDGPELTKLNVTELKYVEVEKNCITLYTTNKRFVLYQSLKSFEKDLNPNCFVRVHRSFVVNLLFVEKIDNLPSGDATLTMTTGEVLKVSRTFKPILLSKLHGL